MAREIRGVNDILARHVKQSIVKTSEDMIREIRGARDTRLVTSSPLCVAVACCRRARGF